MTFKDLKKIIVLETAQKQSKFVRLNNKPFSIGMLKNIGKKTLEQTVLAALIILLAYHRRMELINHFTITREEHLSL